MTPSLNRKQVAWRIAQDLPDGAYVNLGIGSPELVANYISGEREIIFHSENGLLGMGPVPDEGAIEPDLINAGKKPVTILPGGSYFNHTDSFVMVRGGHIDICVLGAYQVSARGDLANWATRDNSKLPAVGGAMDLAVGAKKIFVMTDHCARDGSPKILEDCTYPLTGAGVVKRIFTDIAVIDITEDGLMLREKVSGLSVEDVQERTGAPLGTTGEIGELAAPDI